ncbi:hypothetical protein L593_06280 [Salinarchaeum sp. Harcht-Bsk1]|uniref:hypothetical protein n=1 Tax=Salinarchaeum sp. Harcht-Bsk1 TaxID=1333523 RepID=UPI0003424261|nr:hypothetical protein [Salinarchaeum sp. Harcht-Bsk1]AGN01205.1 hypothetical protein L593_06280 [Salinarchaeum sp. Harcht-Bsk1]
MTDAALPVTERAVEQFVEEYLTSIGGEIQKRDRTWSVTLPDAAPTELDIEGTDLVVASDPEEVPDGALAIAPDSDFVNRLLEEAGKLAPVGSFSLTAGTFDLQNRLPSWITGGPAQVLETSFSPYYDRRALCVLFDVGIETVSQFQSEELRAVAVDAKNAEPLPRLAETYLEVTGADSPPLEEGKELDAQALETTLDAAKEQIEQEIAPTVEEIRERATRAADVELEEYREVVRQRRQELDDEIDRLDERIAEISKEIDSADEQHDRVEALRTRKQLRADREELAAERDELVEKIEAGFPEQRREIRDRHALTVRVQPSILTTVTYERGDIEYQLEIDGARTTVTCPYAVGIGVMEAPTCSRCGRTLDGESALTIEDGEVVGNSCCER